MSPKQQMTLKNSRQCCQKKKILRKLKTSHQKSTQTAGEMANPGHSSKSHRRSQDRPSPPGASSKTCAAVSAGQHGNSDQVSQDLMEFKTDKQ